MSECDFHLRLEMPTSRNAYFLWSLFTNALCLLACVYAVCTTYRVVGFINTPLINRTWVSVLRNQESGNKIKVGLTFEFEPWSRVHPERFDRARRDLGDQYYVFNHQTRDAGEGRGGLGVIKAHYKIYR